MYDIGHKYSHAHENLVRNEKTEERQAYCEHSGETLKNFFFKCLFTFERKRETEA